MTEKNIVQNGALDADGAIAFHRRQMDALTPPDIKNPRFDGAKQLVVDLLEGRATSLSPIQPAEFTAVNTDAQALYLPKKPEDTLN